MFVCTGVLPRVRQFDRYTDRFRTLLTVGDGTIELVHDEDIDGRVLEMVTPNVATTKVTCPAPGTKPLGITLPIIVLLIKSTNDNTVSFEVQVKDSKLETRRFRASTYQNSARVQSSICTMPLKLQHGWNEVRFDMREFLMSAYGTTYKETMQVSIHGSCRVRRIYFTDKLYQDSDLPPEFKLFKPHR